MRHPHTSCSWLLSFQCMPCIRWTGSSPVEWRNLRRCLGTVPDLHILIVLGCQACMQGSDITTASSVFRILPQYLLFSILEQIFTSHIGWQCRLGTFVKFRIEISFLEARLGKWIPLDSMKCFYCFFFLLDNFYLHFKCYPLSWFPLLKSPISSLLPLLTNHSTLAF